jgi:DNA polymerase elongation subunit (family B)
MNNHGKVFTISDASQLESKSLIPRRSSILDSSEISKTTSIIDNRSPLLFLANDVEQSISKNQYKLILHGITPCGSKTTTIITGILPYIDVEVNDIENLEQEQIAIQSKLQSNNIDFVAAKSADGQDFMHFSDTTKQYIRVYFNTLKNRLDCIKLCEEDNIKTFSNDRSTYYRVVGREHEINLSGWNTLYNYNQTYGSKSKAHFVITVDISDIKPFSSERDAIPNYCSAQSLKYEKTIVACFDIEMIPHDLNKFPDADKCLKDSIFMICTTFHFAKKSESILSVNLTLKENDPLDDVVTIVCKSEAVLLLAFSKLFDIMQPDFITEFNGGGFDWRNIIVKTQSFGIITPFLHNMSINHLAQWEAKPNMISRYFVEKVIKIDGATASAFCKTFKMPGYVNFDTLIVFKQLEPNADSHKLNECLKRCKLGSKDDMDIKEMFRIYREGTSEEMKMVAHYCFIDTFKLQSLLLKKNVIQDRREVSILSFTSIYDSFYYANGSKVRNLLMNNGMKKGYKFNTLYKPTIEDPDAKFPGAFVVPPIKGIVRPIMRYDEFTNQCDESLAIAYSFIEKHFDNLKNNTLDKSIEIPQTIRPYIEYMLANENQYPISGLDYSSLYPSIIMAYNISPEKLIVDEKYANQLIEKGYNLKHISFPFLGRDFHAWFVQHNNDEQLYGLCPAILIELFAKRAEIKRILKPYGDKMIEMEIEMKQYPNNSEYPRIEEYDEVCFDYGYYNAKQKALKVFMNTFYGEMGNFLSFVCAVETAASVTTMGQYNLKYAKSYVEDVLKMKVYYGDSVVGDTPIMIKRNSEYELVPIEELDNNYTSYGEKEYIDYSNKNTHVMTENGYSKILKVIRHRTNKRLFRITTSRGSVVVTEDHSLLDLNKSKIKPQNCTIGTQLLHWENTLYENSHYSNNSDLAYIKGFFFGGSYELITPDLQLLHKYVQIFNNYYSEIQLQISKDSKLYRAEVVGNIQILNDEFYSSRMQKKIPQDILNSDRTSKLSFIQGYYDGGGNNIVQGQIGSHGLYLLLLDIGQNVRIYSENNAIYRLSYDHSTIESDAIESIVDMGICSEYVYDLETESHHFAAGVGQIVVHNTDSLYLACNKNHFNEIDKQYFTGKIDKIDYATQLVSKTFELIEIAKHEVNDHLVKDNGTKFLKMAYEEVLYPAVFLSKKKYIGIPHEEVINFYPLKPFMKGLEVVKRGTSDVLKNICMRVIMEILDIKCTKSMLELVETAIKRFFTNKWDVNHFVKTAVYRLDKNNIPVRKMIARYVAEKYKIIPEPNVRFKYVLCKKYPWTFDARGNQTILSNGDKMELVERVIEENIPVDLEYYFNNEITGQMARLIAYEAIFDTIDRDAIDLSLTEKQRYKKIEEDLFKNARRHISKIAKEYSHPYINQNKLFKQTYKMVKSIVIFRNKTNNRVETIYQPIVRRVVDILYGCDSDTSIEYLKSKINTYINKYYEICIDVEYSKIEPLYKFISDNKLNKYMTDCSEQWIANIVQFIHDEFDYETICEISTDTHEVGDLFSKEYVKDIVSDKKLYYGLSPDSANRIIDFISTIVAIYVN